MIKANKGKGIHAAMMKQAINGLIKAVNEFGSPAKAAKVMGLNEKRIISILSGDDVVPRHWWRNGLRSYLAGDITAQDYKELRRVNGVSGFKSEKKEVKGNFVPKSIFISGMGTRTAKDSKKYKVIRTHKGEHYLLPKNYPLPEFSFYVSEINGKSCYFENELRAKWLSLPTYRTVRIINKSQ